MLVTRTKGIDAPPAVSGGAATADRAKAESLPAGCRVELVTSATGLAALAEAWRRLENPSTSRAGVFQSWAWVEAWTETYLNPGNPVRPSVVAGYRDGRLVFLWPLMRGRCGPVKVLRWLTEPLGQYGDIVIARGESARSWGAAALEALDRAGGFDLIRLRHVRADAAVMPIIARHFRNAQSPDRAPWMDLASFAGDAAYEARYSATQRRRRKKLRKGLEGDFGPVAFQFLTGAEALAAISEAVTEKGKWIDDRGRHNQVFGCDELVQFLQSLSNAPGPDPRLVVSRMTAGGQPISWEIGLRYGASHYGFITSHVTDYTDYSPGRLHMDFSQRAALADGMAVFDLMVPDDPHKESWSSAAVETEDYYRASSLAGLAYGRLYLENLRPLMRRTYYRMSPALLRLLKPVIGH
jgi:CelD/BcsL family acetyltransferase involved in cellulose biosynthesis